MNKNRRIKDDDLKRLVVALPSDIHGTGLFSRRDISEGEYIGTFHGPEVKEDGNHVLWVESEQVESEQVESEYTGIRGENLLRFLNHDSPGNAAFYGHDLYASDDIATGSEITLDYSG
jgi:uncharacterized protein